MHSYGMLSGPAALLFLKVLIVLMSSVSVISVVSAWVSKNLFVDDNGERSGSCDDMRCS